MTQPLDNACNEIVTVLRNTGAFGQVPLNPPSMMSYSEFAIVHPASGRIEVTDTGTRRALHNIAIDVLTKNTDYARAMAITKPFIDIVAHALEVEVSYDSDGNPGGLFNNSISTFTAMSYIEIPLTDYGGVPVLGYRCLMEDVKIRTNL